MGLEAYVFQLVFEGNLSKNELDKILKQNNFVIKEKELNSINYEQVNEYSIIEVQAIFDEKVVNNIFIRFCVSNPLNVVEDLFLLFENLSKTILIKVRDFQASKVVYSSTINEFDFVKESTIKQKKSLEKLYGRVNKPINCNDYWKYVEKYNLGKAKWSKQD